jgi:periplasmic copper chaperone A
MRIFASSRWAVAVAVAIVVGLAVLAACTSNGGPGAGSGAPGGLSIIDAHSPPAPAGGMGGAFLTVVNAGSTPDRLVSARSPVAQAVEIHETIDDNGVMKMRPVTGGFEVPANGKLELQPGGKHLMFAGLAQPLTTGTEYELTLVFEKAGERTIKVPVKQQ